MRNVVFIPNINLGDGRSNPYDYSIASGPLHDFSQFLWVVGS